MLIGLDSLVVVIVLLRPQPAVRLVISVQIAKVRRAHPLVIPVNLVDSNTIALLHQRITEATHATLTAPKATHVTITTYNVVSARGT